MSIYHDEVEIEDFEYDEDDEMYYYPCPCGDRFQITKVFKVLCSAHKPTVLPNLLIYSWFAIKYPVVGSPIKFKLNESLKHTYTPP